MSDASVGIVDQALSNGRASISFELFPPKTAQGEKNLWEALHELDALTPTFVSVTYGAGGTTRDLTVRITERIASQTSLSPVGHLTCVGATRDQVQGVIEQYRAAGVRTVLALRGDPPGGLGTPWVQHEGGFKHADELVAMLASYGDMSIGVGAFPDGHPESVSVQQDADVLAAKQAAGAHFAITQFFFSADRYFESVELAKSAGCSMPIIPGIMPLTNFTQVQRFAELSGVQVPSELAKRARAVADDPEAVRELGIAEATRLCQQLLDGGAPGLHFYTLNRSSATREIYANLGLS
ncbi:unannotated protein [freshwater metagenome]|uniref:methylenetetrahydrofolate reductase (NADH) n=1 Tax=freshwater metagenome TaxID=449393 RepID=A0A6J7DJJ7_9ZZZZ|nr:methylenetetrahydrofolate reductase [NAD(P)H] [Actinomycetota bacterium]